MGVTLRHFLFLLVVAFAVTYACMPLAKRLACKLGAIDYPNSRRVNTVPTPRMGGLAVCSGMLAALLMEVVGERWLGWAGFFLAGDSLEVSYAGVLLGVLTVTAVGAIDDVRSLTPGVKFLGQVAGAAIIVASGVLLSSIANPFSSGFIEFGWLSYPLTVFYLVAFMNVINLVDGLDGLAAGIVAIASLTLFAIAVIGGRVEAAMLSIVLLGAVLAFLRFNYPPASVFMGDSGSLLMGCTLGVISLLGVMRSPAVIVLAAPLTIAAIPIADTLFAIIRRLKRHQPIQQADTGHLHHLLLRKGYSTRKSVAIVHLWTAMLAVGAFVMSNTHGVAVFATFLMLVGASFFILWCLGIFAPVLKHHYHPRGNQGASSQEEDAGRSSR